MEWFLVILYYKHKLPVRKTYLHEFQLWLQLYIEYEYKNVE